MMQSAKLSWKRSWRVHVRGSPSRTRTALTKASAGSSDSAVLVTVAPHMSASMPAGAGSAPWSGGPGRADAPSA
ncbi:hypothetical protein GCM10023353_16840 [Tomitella cavernea]|uniref:Uncharacterized protein n=1 Tax=Tomitella cavernea TaxID=1387982 RepID=A0ABP9CJI6_9ACTN